MCPIAGLPAAGKQRCNWGGVRKQGGGILGGGGERGCGGAEPGAGPRDERVGGEKKGRKKGIKKIYKGGGGINGRRKGE